LQEQLSLDVSSGEEELNSWTSKDIPNGMAKTIKNVEANV
jgi:hypothetical protein